MNKLNIKRILPILVLLIFSESILALDNYELPSGEWRLISLPLDPGSDSTINSLFGDDIKGVYGSEWLIYGYDPVAKSYETKSLNDRLQYGVGYWILQITGKSAKLDLPADSVESTAVILAAPDEGEKFLWNFVGYPLSVSKKFSNLKIRTSSGACANEGCDPSNAKTQKIFQNEVWRLSRTDNKRYEKISGEDTLNPWDGIWCATLENANKVGTVELTSDSSPLPPIAGDWMLTFSDDFNGTSLDPNYWRLGEHFLGINGKAGNSAKHTIVRNGKLELIAEKTPITFGGKHYEYATSEVSTYQKFRQAYGYFESRIKYDAVQGVWPAFWTMPDRGNYGNEDLKEESYIGFDLGNITQPVSSAILKVKVMSIEYPDKPSNISIFRLLDNEWGEQTINWENKPAYDPVWLRQFSGNGEINQIVAGEYLEVDVTNYINTQIASNKKAGFALADTFRKQNRITLGSKEAGNTNDWPRLVIDGSDIYPDADASVKAGIHTKTNFGMEADLGAKDSWAKGTSAVSNGGMELDIMESLGIWGDDVTQHALHWDRYGPGHPKAHSDVINLTSTADGYHIYGMYWAPGHLEFYIDGNKTWEYDNPRTGSIASYILLSHQLGGWDGNANIRDDLFPATMYVDYVRVWSGSSAR